LKSLDVYMHNIFTPLSGYAGLLTTLAGLSWFFHTAFTRPIRWGWLPPIEWIQSSYGWMSTWNR